MPVLIGVLFGNLFTTLLGRVGFWRAAATAALWFGVGWGGHRLVEANVGAAAAPWGAIFAPVALLTWTLWRPAASRLKLWLFDGLYVLLRLSMFFIGFRAVLDLFGRSRRIAPWLAQEWRLLLALGVLWLVQRGMIAWLRRSLVRPASSA